MTLGEMLGVSLDETPGTTSTIGTWSASGSIINIGSTGSSCMFEAISTGTGNFTVTVTNGCGTSVEGGGAVNVSGGGGPGPLMVYPNPATESFEIQLDDAVVSADQELMESELRIYDQYNNLKEIKKFKGKKHKVYTYRYTDGFYFIEVINTNGRYTTKLIISK